VIVNAGVMPAQPEALQFAAAADGIVLAFRFGRRPQREDRDLMAMLERIGANVLGVIAVAGEADRRPEPAYRPPVEETQAPRTAPRVLAAQLPPLPVVQATKEAV
jgi:Mrp family chromosome partitioning ATPase